MIGRLHGQLLMNQPPWLLIDVGGVGYELEAPLSVCATLPPCGSTVTLITHLLVREDAQLLFGFLHAAERELFRLLIKMSGIGARSALAILSTFTAAQFAHCIAHEDVTALCRVPGIGRKTAQRLIVECKERVSSAAANSESSLSGVIPVPMDVITDSISALITLGYKPAEAQRMVRQVHSEDMTTELLIRAALRAAV